MRLTVILLLTLLAGSAGAQKIYLNPSDQIHNLSPDKTYNEAEAMKVVAQMLQAKLSARGFEVRNSDGGTMSEATTAANAWPADIYISLHTNARGGEGWGTPHGTLALYFQPRDGSAPNPISIELAQRCMDKCVEKYTTYGVGHPFGVRADLPFLNFNLFVLRRTDMPGTLVEGLFHDNEADTACLKTDEGRDAYAQGVYEALCDHFSRAYYLDAPILDPVGSVANDSNGWLAVVIRGDKGNAMVVRQTGINAAWSGEWLDLEGDIEGEPAIARNAQGRLQAFVRGPGNRVWHKVQSSVGVKTWNGWYDLGGNAAADPVAMAAGGNGLILIAVVGSDGHLRYKAQTRADSALAWDRWVDLGGGFSGRPAIGWDYENNPILVCRTRGDTLKWAIPTVDPKYTRWNDLAGKVAGDPLMLRDERRNLALFCLGLDGNVVYRMRKGSGWDAWQDIGGDFLAGPVVSVNTGGWLEVFAIDAHGAVLCNSQGSEGKWSGWQSLGGSFVGSPMVGRNRDGRIEVFARTADGKVQYRVQREPMHPAIWDGWYPLGDTVTELPTPVVK